MQYVLLIYRNPEAYDALTEAEYAALVQRYQDFADRQREAGRFQASVRLREPRHTLVARKTRAGEPLGFTDGPFAETKELLAGLFVLDCASREEAERAAAELPAAQDGGAVEIRPVFDIPAFLGS